MTDTTDALELLKSQHDDVEALIGRIEDCEDLDEKLELFAELADKLAAHSTIEEKLFYPSVLDDDTTELLIEATEEHLAVKRVLADMLALDPDDDHWDAKLAVLKEEVRHHARDEEEGKLFPILERALTEDFRAALGNELLAMFEELLEQEPRNQVPSETTEAAPLEVGM
ncbi:MAG: hemerythrin domain-containing protein [Acidobacteriota bacterium]